MTFIATQGNVVDDSVTCKRFANSFQIRGVSAAIEVAGSECLVTLTVGGATKAAINLVGRAGDPTYVRVGGSGPVGALNVPPGTKVCVKTEVTGTNTGLTVDVDTIP